MKKKFEKKIEKKRNKIQTKSNCIHMFNVTYYSTDLNKSLMKLRHLVIDSFS